MPISKNIPMALNKSSDERLLKPNEMTDAQNVTVSTDSDGNGFVLKNSRGNAPIQAKSGSQITQNEARNSFEVLGSCVDGEANTLYFIVYDGSGNVSHGVYRIDFNSSVLEYEAVVVSRYLFSGSSKPEFVDMDVIRADVNQEGSIVPILYMTDNVSEPKKINVERAIAAGHAPTADIREFLSVAKTKPVHQFDIIPRKDPDFSGNFVYGKSLSFAVQWVYQDGERSALSNISDCVIPQTVLTSEEDGTRKDDVNYYQISVPKGSTEVKQINVYYRDNETGLMYLADRLQRDEDLVRAVGPNQTTIYDESEGTYRFYGDRDQEPAPLIETNKLFDNVPLRAKTQCIADGRLIYGNYSEGRELPDITAEFEVEYDQPYDDDYLIIGYEKYVDGTNTRVNGMIRNSVTQSQSGIELDFSNLPATIASGTTIVIDFTFYSSRSSTFITCADNDGGDELFSFTANGETWHIGRKDVGGDFYEAIFKDMPDIRFTTAYYVSSDTAKSTVLSALRTQIANLRVTTKYSNPQNTGSTAIRDDDGATLSDVKITDAEITFKCEAQVTGDLIQCGLLYHDALDGSLVFTKTATVISNPNANPGGSGNERGFVGMFSTVVDDMHDLRSFTKAIVDDTNQFKSFKRGANHTFGMILYDDKGRSSFVKEIGSVYVERKGEQGGATNGKASITVKFPQVGGFNQTLPSWVSKYQIVYGGSDIEDFKQYSVSGGFANYWSYSLFDTTDSKEDASKNIYVSLKGWSGSKSSYTGENGANHVYNPKEGDMLRIVQYDINDEYGQETRFYPENLEFSVIGKTTLRKDVVTEDINLIRAEQEFEKEREEAKASRREKRAEKRRKKGKEGPGLLTRIGKGFDKLREEFDEFQEENPMLDRLITTRREKQENLDDAAEDATDKIKDTPISARNPVFPGGQITYDVDGNPNRDTEDMPMAKGEFLILKDSGFSSWGRNDSVQVKFDGSNEIAEVSDDSDGVNKHWFAILNWARNVVVEVYTPGKGKSERIYIETPDVHSYGVGLPTAGHTVNTGDVWLKRVPVRYNKKEQNATNRLASHYFRYWDIEGMSFKNMYLESSQASHYFPSDAAVFGRSHFINRYASENNRRHSITYSDRYSSDSPFLNLSNFNLSRANFVDLDSSYGGIDRLFSNDGFLNCIQSGKASRIPLGQTSVQLGANSDMLTSADQVIGKPSYYAGHYGTRGKTQMSVIQDGTVFFTDLTAKKVLQVTGNGISAISDAGMDSFFQDQIESWDALPTKPRVFMGYDPDYNEVLVAMSPFVDSPNSINFQGFVAAYNVGMQRWTSVYDFTSGAADSREGPTLFANIGNRLISCFYTTDPDYLNEEFIFYEHKEGVTKAKYYGNQKTSVVEVVANDNPSMVKVFESVSLEGDHDGWTAAVTTSDQNAEISSSDWQERERGYYAMMPRDESSNSTSQRIYIPVSVSQNTTALGNTIVFDSKINRLGIPTGAELYNVTQDEEVTLLQGGIGAPVVVSSCAGNTITLSSFFSVADVVEAGDVLYAVLPQDVYGDAIRDYFCKIKLTSSSSSDLELFAINTHYDRSKLGQEKG